MTTMTDLKTFICNDLLGGQEVGTADDLLLSGLVDSMGVMRLVDFIEQSDGITVPPQDVIIENFQTIDAITAYLSARSAG